jgi:hypothetical protein
MNTSYKLETIYKDGLYIYLINLSHLHFLSRTKATSNHRKDILQPFVVQIVESVQPWKCAFRLIAYGSMIGLLSHGFLTDMKDKEDRPEKETSTYKR